MDEVLEEIRREFDADGGVHTAHHGMMEHLLRVFRIRDNASDELHGKALERMKKFERRYARQVREACQRLLRRREDTRTAEERTKGTLHKFFRPSGGVIGAANRYTLTDAQIKQGCCRARVWAPSGLPVIRQCLTARKGDALYCGRHLYVMEKRDVWRTAT